MKTLIVEDDFTCRLLVQEILKGYGPVHVASNGTEAVAAFGRALDGGTPYDLVCMDIMMPGKDGQETLAEMREIERKRGIQFEEGSKIVMLTALGDMRNVMGAFGNLCNAYLRKPISKDSLLEEIGKLGLPV